MGCHSSAPTLITDPPEPWDEWLVPRVLCFELMCFDHQRGGSEKTKAQCSYNWCDWCGKEKCIYLHPSLV